MNANEQALSTLWQVTSEGVILVAADLTIAAVNPGAERVLGQPARYLVGQPLQLWAPDAGLVEALRDGRRVSAGVLCLGRRNFRWQLHQLGLEGKDRASLLVLRDAAELQQMAEELAETQKWERILMTVLDAAYDGIVVVDENAVITLFNQPYADWLGVKREAVIGKPVQDVIENTRMHIVVKTGQPEYRQVQRIQGHDMICDRIPIREGSRIIGAVGKVLFRDISEVGELLERSQRLQQELEYYKGQLNHQLQARYSLDAFIGQSRAILDLKEMVRRVAYSSSTVLLRGESGTGKEMLAHALHNASSRHRGPFVKINCAAIPETLLESELFGYAEGAFTGARKGGRIGKFEQADGGTLLLDEIGDMPLSMQIKLLRVLQDKEVERVGGVRPVRVDVRLIAATNQKLETLVAEGHFRQDLFYRLNVITLEIPPLRERKEDLPVLTEALLEKLGRTLGCGKKGIGPEALQVLLRHHWPGNVRELENVLERALNVIDGPRILPRHLPYYLTESHAGDGPALSLKEALARTERKLLKQALAATQGNHLAAARLLGLSKSTFYEKMARYEGR